MNLMFSKLMLRTKYKWSLGLTEMKNCIFECVYVIILVCSS